MGHAIQDWPPLITTVQAKISYIRTEEVRKNSLRVVRLAWPGGFFGRMRFGLTENLLQCSYDKSAYLQQVCWLSVKGSMECFLPVGTYTFSWRLAFQDDYGFTRRGGDWPIEFTMSVNDHETVQRKIFLRDGQSSSEGEHSSDDEDHTDWNELYVGDFTVEEGEKDSGIGRVKLQYSLVEIKGGHWKSGLWLDGVVIMPKQQGMDWLRHAIATGNGIEQGMDGWRRDYIEAE